MNDMKVYISTPAFEEILQASEEYYLEDYKADEAPLRMRIVEDCSRVFRLGDVVFIEETEKGEQ